MISINWIKDYVNLDDVDVNKLAKKLTESGINVESVIQKHIENLVIGYVENVENHPNSDHLHVCMVNTGTKTIQIVCGAPNVKENTKVIVSLPGCVLPGNIEIKESVIRGVSSYGMICSLEEIGIESDEEGIHILNDDAIVGENALKYLGCDDTIFSLDLNPNRNIDCTNHIGFAYEVGSVLGKKVTLPNLVSHPIKESVKDIVNVKVETSKCSLYNVKYVKNVVIKESPKFIKERLISAGMRPINNVVDISNYVMLEYGQPLHFFDADKLGNNILVRDAYKDEEIVTIDKKKRILSENDIVITDSKNPVCIAGVMGSLNTEVDESTTNIIIESAIFEPLSIRKTSIRLDLRSESSLRFERGLNYEYTFDAIERACYLLEFYADGKVLNDIITYDKTNRVNKECLVTTNDMNSILGLNMTNDDVKESLNKLMFNYEFNNGVFNVHIPNRRLDVEAHIQDIAEEVGRIYGFDKIVPHLPLGETKQGKYIGNILEKKLISKRCKELGFDEVRTYTLVNDELINMVDYNKEETISLLSPMSYDKKNIRKSLVPSLLNTVDYNMSRGVKDISIYEISNVYYGKYVEETKVSLALTGNYLCNSANKVNVKADFYLLKGVVEDLLNYMGFKNRYSFHETNINILHPFISAEIFLDNDSIGFIGQVHPNVSKNQNLFVSEISVSKICDKVIKPIKFKEVSKYPNIYKDVAFIVDKDINASLIIDSIKKCSSKNLTSVNVFDVYEGANLEAGKKSLAFALEFESMERTLTEEEVMIDFNKIIDTIVKKYNAILRNK